MKFCIILFFVCVCVCLIKEFLFLKISLKSERNIRDLKVFELTRFSYIFCHFIYLDNVIISEKQKLGNGSQNERNLLITLDIYSLTN